MNMSESVSNAKKKHFLKWFTKNFELKRRESLWILDYLFNHDIMLEKTHFVEQAKKAPRGIYMSVTGSDNPAFHFYKNGHTFEDAMQGFHDIRLNWSSQLYIEIDFQDAWIYPEYLAVLEDNPYAKWNDSVSTELEKTMDDALTYETLNIAREDILDKIDASLLNGEEESFNALTSELIEIEHKIDQVLMNNL